MEDQTAEEIGFKEIKISDEEIGNGSYGSVHKAVCDNLLCAAKRIHTALVGPANDTPSKRNRRIPVRRFEVEFKFLQELRHPNVIQYLGMYREPISHQPVLLMELMDESLTDYLERAVEPVPYHTQVDICYDITRALSHLHVNEIVHRDLSSNNILLSGKPCRAKLSDFGMAKFLNVRMSRITGALSHTAMPGTVGYMPPEAQDTFSENGDVFSFGVIVVQIITREFPQPGDRFQYIQVNGQQMRACIQEVVRRDNHLSLIPQDHPLLPIALDCLKDVESDRPTACDLCSRLASLKDAMPYKESKEAEENPPQPVTEDKGVDTLEDPLCKTEDKSVDTCDDPLRTTEDKGVNTDSSEVCVVETLSDTGFVSINNDGALEKEINRLKAVVDQKEDVIQDRNAELDGMRTVLELKQGVLDKLISSDDLMRTQQQLQETLNEKETALKALSQENGNLKRSQAEMKEKFDAQLHEKNERITAIQQQLKERDSQIDLQKKQIDELSGVISEQCTQQDKHAQQISERDHQIAQQQKRIDELASEIASQVTSKKKKGSGKGKKAQVQTATTTSNTAIVRDTLQGTSSGPSKSDVATVRIRNDSSNNNCGKPRQTASTPSSSTVSGHSQHIASNLPAASLASTGKESRNPFSDDDFGSIWTNGSSTNQITSESSQREKLAKLRMETSTAKSVTLLSDTQQMAVKTTVALQQQTESFDRIEKNQDTIHTELRKQTAEPEGASGTNNSHAKDPSSDTHSKKSSPGFLSNLFRSKSKHTQEHKKNSSSPNSGTHQLEAQCHSKEKSRTASLQKTAPPLSTGSHRTPSRIQHQSQELREREAIALKKMEESSARSLRTLQDTERLGVATNEELVRQSEGLDKIEERLDVMDARLSRGKQNVKELKSPLGKLGSSSRKAAAKKPSSTSPASPSIKTKLDTPIKPLHQYPSTGSSTVDDNLDRMSDMLTNLEGIGRDQSAMLDQHNAQLERIQVKAERNHDAFASVNTELRKQL